MRATPALNLASAKRVLAKLRESDPLPGKPDKMLLSTTLDHYHFNQQYAVDEDRDGFLDDVRHPDREPIPFPAGTTWTDVVAELETYVSNCNAEHGRWPRDLAEATRDEAADIRRDPFSGKDLGYRLTDDGPLIYSANHDGRDAGGKWPSLGDGLFRRWTDEPGDYILWPVGDGKGE